MSLYDIALFVALWLVSGSGNILSVIPEYCLNRK